MSSTIELSGNTYPIRDALKALGGRCIKRGTAWIWIIPAERKAEAEALLANAPKQKCGGVRRGPRTCATCGCRINYGVYCGKCEFGR